MFITFEGIEGSGKSTLVGLLAEYLENAGIPGTAEAQDMAKPAKQQVCVTREPGGCDLGKTLRTLLLNNAAQLTPEAELFLFLADRAQHVNDVIRPALAAGHRVLCDRYADSTIVYQGYGRGFDPQVLYRMNDVAVQGLWPDLTFVLDMDPALGLQRARTRNSAQGSTDTEGRFEAETLAFHTRIRQGFVHWATHYPQRFAVLNAACTPEQVLQQALERLEKKFGKK